MAEISVTDFFTLSKFGRVSEFTNVWNPTMPQNGRVLTHGPGGS